jgi:glutathione synthase
MPKILFLIGDVANAVNDNHQRLPAEFGRLGWQVVCADHDDLHLHNSRPVCAHEPLDQFDLIWLLGFGRQVNFLDRMQILHLADQARFVNPVDAYMYLHGKYALSDLMVETHAHHDPQVLIDIVNGGGKWVIKPSGGSFGRDVHIVSATDTQIIRRVTAANGYCLLQRYLPQIEQGEKRVLIGAGNLVGHYLRTPQAGGVANLHAGGIATTCELTDDEVDLATTVASRLTAQGVRFAAVDLVYPYLMETNVVNPGGLATISDLTGRNPTAGMIAAIIDSI